MLDTQTSYVIASGLSKHITCLSNWITSRVIGSEAQYWSFPPQISLKLGYYGLELLSIHIIDSYRSANTEINFNCEWKPHNLCMPRLCFVLFLTWFCPWKGQENWQSVVVWVRACVWGSRIGWGVWRHKCSSLGKVTLCLERLFGAVR